MAREALKIFTIFAICICLCQLSLAASGPLLPGACNVKVNTIDASSGKVITDADIRVINYEEKEIYYESGFELGLFENVTSGKLFISVFGPGLHAEIEETTLTCKEDGLETQTITLSVNFSKPVSGKPEKKAATTSTTIVSEPSAISANRSIQVMETPDSGKSNDQSRNGTATKRLSAGVVNGSAVLLAKPDYPASARAVNAQGTVSVVVVIDKLGHVISARALSGHPLLRRPSEKAAVRSEFTTTLLDAQPVEVSGVIVYNYR